MLLQILEDGRLTDSHGRIVNFENTILIMTSNAGTSLKSNGIGFGSDNYERLESKVNSVLKETFRPELLNRIDEIIVFTDLNKAELKQIVDLLLSEILDEAAEKSIRIEITDSAKEYILEKGFDAKFGARPLRRAIQKYIEDELAELFLRGTLKEGCKALIDCADSKLSFYSRS